MGRKLYIAFLGLILSSVVFGQAPIKQLQNFADQSLFNLNDKNCINLSGEWLGGELEFIDQYKTLKGKYSSRFLLSQEGNKITGISYISSDSGQNYGNLRIRGLVAGNKFYFEEYEIPDQKFIKPNTVWCLRTGELDIKLDGNNLILTGSNYKGYADQYYFECAGFVIMDLRKPIKASDANDIKADVAGNRSTEMQLRPNPAEHQVGVHFSIQEDAQVQIDMFTLSGNFVANVTNEFYTTGTHEKLFDLSPFAAGAYLIRMSAGKQNVSRILVITH